MYLLFIEIIGFFGLIWIQGISYKRGELTENRFALLIVTYLSLLTLTGILIVSTTFEVTIIGFIIFSLWWVLGYPFARWVHKQFFPIK